MNVPRAVYNDISKDGTLIFEHHGTILVRAFYLHCLPKLAHLLWEVENHLIWCLPLNGSSSYHSQVAWSGFCWYRTYTPNELPLQLLQYLWRCQMHSQNCRSKPQPVRIQKQMRTISLQIHIIQGRRKKNIKSEKNVKDRVIDVKNTLLR